MRILITDKVHDILVSGLSQLGEVTYSPMMSYAEVRRVISDFDGLIINSKVICDEAFLDQARHLKWIGRLGSGLDIFDLPHARFLGIEIINSPEGNANAVGEHCLGMLLSLNHNITKSNLELRQGYWSREPNRGLEIKSRTIGIIGFGHTGRSLAEKLKGFDVTIIAHDIFLSNVPDGFEYVELVSKERITQEADIISFHLPLTELTRDYVDKDFIEACKAGVVILNTSRGKVVNSADLLTGLKSKRIGGACLDVIENEKMDNWTPEEKNIYTSLMDLPNVIMTPHIAGWTHESFYKIARVLLDKILKFQKSIV